MTSKFTSPAIIALNALSDYEDELEEKYAPPSDDTEERLHSALADVSESGLELIQTGQIPSRLRESLADFRAWDTLTVRIEGLVMTEYVQARLFFAVVEAAIERCQKADDRVLKLSAMSGFLTRLEIPLAVQKYLMLATDSYLTGGDATATLLFASALERAIEFAVSDEYLSEQRTPGACPRTGIYTLEQRMESDRASELLTTDMQQKFWDVINWRNDILNTQPNMGPDPDRVLAVVVGLLRRLLPTEDSSSQC